jgi:hypothetical protein
MTAITLKERVNKMIAENIASAQLLDDPRYAGCYAEDLNRFYLDWHVWTTAGKPILGHSKEHGIWFSPADEFCPFCELDDNLQVKFDEREDKLSITMHSLMNNALTSAKRLEEAVLDVWITYMMYISPNIHNAEPSNGTRSAGCRFDMPSVTCNTLIDHFTKHLMPPHNILLMYVLQDAQQQWAVCVPDAVAAGRLGHTSIAAAIQTLPATVPASIRKRVN